MSDRPPTLSSPPSPPGPLSDLTRAQRARLQLREFIRRHPTIVIGGSMLLLIALAALCAPLIARDPIALAPIAARAERAVRALHAPAEPQANARLYGLPTGTPPMLFAMGDGNHSLATAKALWDRIKASVGMDHPARWALVEVENIHDPALAFEPIHRLLLGVKGDVRAALRRAFGEKLAIRDQPSAPAMRARLHELDAARASGRVGAARQAAGLIGPGAQFAVVEIADPPSSLAVGTLQPFADRFVEEGGAAAIDYVHGDEVLERIAQQPGHVGLHIGTVSKSELLQRVVREGPLPRKTFSIGEAHEKRFYAEARRIR